MTRKSLLSAFKIILPAILLLALAACSAAVEPPVSETRVNATLPPVATDVPPTPTNEPPPPTPTAEEIAPAPTATPEAAPVVDPPQADDTLPVLNAVDIVLVDHAGGIPQSVTVVGTTLYAGFGPRLVTYDISDPAAPVWLGHSAPLGDIIRGLSVAGDHVFVAAGRAGIVIVDVTDPAAPAVVATPQYPAAIEPAAERLFLAGNRLFVNNFDRFDGSRHLLWFDMAEPIAVSFIDAFALQANDNIAVTETIIAITGHSLEVRLTNDPKTVTDRQNLAGASYASHVVVVDDVAYIALAGERNGFEHYDLSDPADIRQIGELTAMEFFFVNQPVSDGDTLVTVSTFGEFGHCGSQIFVVTIDEALSPATQFDPENCTSALALHNDLLYVVGRAGIQIYDLANPAAPQLVSTVVAPAGFMDVQGFALDPERDGRGYIRADNGRTFDALPITLNGERIRAEGERLTIGTRTLLDIFPVGPSLVVPEWMGGLNTLGVDSDGRLELLYQPPDNDIVSGDHQAMAVKGNVLYANVIDHKESTVESVAGLIGAIGAIDLRDPAQPRLAAVVETGSPQIVSLAVDGDTLYALNQGEENQVVIIDIADPLAPQVIARFPLPEPTSRLIGMGDTLYVACDKWNCQHLYVIDVSDRTEPKSLGRWRLPFGVQAMVAGHDDLIFLATVDEGFGILDVSDPARPALVGYEATPPTYMRLVSAGDTLYAAAFDTGLYVYRIER